MDSMQSFLAERWYVVAIAAIVLFFVFKKIIKTMVKWAIVLAILAGLVVYGSRYRDKVGSMGKSVSSRVVSDLESRATEAIHAEAKSARYHTNSDGSFTVSTKSVKLVGKPGSHQAQVTFMDHTFTMKMDDALQALIEQAKKSGLN